MPCSGRSSRRPKRPYYYVTHAIREAVALGARIVVLEHGRVVADALPELAAAPPTPFVRALFTEMGADSVRPLGS